MFDILFVLLYYLLNTRIRKKENKMSWSFDNNKPIYLQIMEKIKFQIISHELEANQQLPTVRELAREIGVNTNTIQRAFSNLEQDGFVFCKRTAGRFVTENQELISKSRKQLAEKQLKDFISSMAHFGYQEEELPAIISDYIKRIETTNYNQLKPTKNSF